MLYIILGSVSFLLFFLYDYNSIAWKNPLIHRFFFIGSVILLTVTVAMLLQFQEVLRTGIIARPFWFLSFIGFSGLLIYTLFFALPFDDTYIQNPANRKAYKNGIYALCRHPGVLWFIGLYFSLYLLTKEPLFFKVAAVWSFWNILYTTFQDLWIFPRTFVDYRLYQAKTPFLIPNRSSFRRVTGKSKERSSL